MTNDNLLVDRVTFYKTIGFVDVNDWWERSLGWNENYYLLQISDLRNVIKYAHISSILK